MEIPMTYPRLALSTALGLCLAALAGCSGKADGLTDAELSKLLHTEGQPDYRVDTDAVNCLRAWSGDGQLQSGLPEAYLGDHKDECRRTVQGWLNDATRNPQQLLFTDLAKSKPTERAMKLLAALPALPAAEQPVVAPPPPPVAAPAAPVNTFEPVGETTEQRFNSSAEELDHLCQQARQIIERSQLNNADLTRRVNECVAGAGEIRAQMSAETANNSGFGKSALAKSSQMAVRSAQVLLNEVQRAADAKR
jgi:hypothetical protein